MSTVQAPHCPWSHPFFEPVSPSRSRSRSSTDIRLSTSTARGSPLTIAVTWDISVFSMTSTARRAFFFRDHEISEFVSGR
jgi:hypothetical protein